MNIVYEQAATRNDLLQIKELQADNHRHNISVEKGLKDGFLSVIHGIELLEQMNMAAPHIIAKADNKVVGYALVMLESFEDMVPVLKPMFEMIKTLSYHEKKITGYRYYVMGQICVAENYRGMGVFDQLYQKHKEVYGRQFDICVTEVSARNLRSMRAHERVGFLIIHTYQDDTDEWNIIVWDWS